jgi:hypothetical protein
MQVFPKAELMNSGIAPNRKFAGVKLVASGHFSIAVNW